MPADPKSLFVWGDYNNDALVDCAHFNNLVSVHHLSNAYLLIFYSIRVMPLSSALIDHIFTTFDHIVADNRLKPWITSGIRTSCKNKNMLWKFECQNKYTKEQYAAYLTKLTSICKRKMNRYSCAFKKNVKNTKLA